MEDDEILTMLKRSASRQWTDGANAIDDFYSDPPVNNGAGGVAMHSMLAQEDVRRTAGHPEEHAVNQQHPEITVGSEHHHQPPEQDTSGNNEPPDEFATLLDDLEDVQGHSEHEDTGMPDADISQRPVSKVTICAVPVHSIRSPAPSPTNIALEERSTSAKRAEGGIRGTKPPQIPLRNVSATPSLPLRTSPKCAGVVKGLPLGTTTTTQDESVPSATTPQAPTPPSHTPSNARSGPPTVGALQRDRDTKTFTAADGLSGGPVSSATETAPETTIQAILVPLEEEDRVSDVLKTEDNVTADEEQDTMMGESSLELDNSDDNYEAQPAVTDEQIPAYETEICDHSKATAGEVESARTGNKELDSRRSEVANLAGEQSSFAKEVKTPLPATLSNDLPKKSTSKGNAGTKAQISKTAPPGCLKNKKPSPTKRTTRSARKSEEPAVVMQHQALGSDISSVPSSEKPVWPDLPSKESSTTTLMTPVEQDESLVKKEAEPLETTLVEPPRKKMKRNSTKSRGDFSQLMLDPTTKTIETNTKGKNTRQQVKEAQAAQPNGAAAAKKRHRK